jgi:hypothetical protein
VCKLSSAERRRVVNNRKLGLTCSVKEPERRVVVVCDERSAILDLRQVRGCFVPWAFCRAHGRRGETAHAPRTLLPAALSCTQQRWSRPSQSSLAKRPGASR